MLLSLEQFKRSWAKLKNPWDLNKGLLSDGWLLYSGLS